MPAETLRASSVTNDDKGPRARTTRIPGTRAIGVNNDRFHSLKAATPPKTPKEPTLPPRVASGRLRGLSGDRSCTGKPAYTAARATVDNHRGLLLSRGPRFSPRAFCLAFLCAVAPTEQVAGRTKSHPPGLLREGVKDARWFVARVLTMQKQQEPQRAKPERL